MSNEKEQKKPTIPLTTVTNMVSSVVNDKVKVSKSFIRLVRHSLILVMPVDARVR